MKEKKHVYISRRLYNVIRDEAREKMKLMFSS